MELDRIIHQPIRCRILTYLVAQGPADYVTIRSKFDLTDGHMTTHMRELIEAKYVSFEKDFVDNKRPRTTYKITALGRKQLIAYSKAIHKILAGE